MYSLHETFCGSMDGMNVISISSDGISTWATEPYDGTVARQAIMIPMKESVMRRRSILLVIMTPRKSENEIAFI